MKILWVTNVPSPYRVDFFCELGKYCDLTVIFEKITSTERDESWVNHKFNNFNGIIMKGKEVDVDKAICIEIIRFLKKDYYHHIVISNMATPTGIMAIEYMKFRNIKYLIEGDGGFAKNGKGLKETFKKHLIKGANGYFSTSISHDEYLLAYGAKKEQIYRYPFSSLRDKEICSGIMDYEDKQKIKKELGVKQEKVVLSVGQFIVRKGYDILFRACKEIDPDIGIYIVGGKPTDSYSRLIEDLKLNNIHLINYKSKEELKKYYRMADLFVLPTREDIWGLVINEAMAFGLPIITTNKCAAGLELITNNINGFLIPVEDEKILAKKINSMIENDDLRIEMARNNLNKIKDYTIETMVKRHMDVFSQIPC